MKFGVSKRRGKFLVREGSDALVVPLYAFIREPRLTFSSFSYGVILLHLCDDY